MPVGGFVRLVPRQGSEQELLERALEIAEDIRNEPGNVLALVMQDPENPRDVLMFELFKDQAAIEAHRVAAHSVVKGPAVHAILETPMHIQRVVTIGSRD